MGLVQGLFHFAPMIKWSHIMLHHSLTEDGKTVSWQAIRRYHVETNKWSDIGYHYGIELINDQYEVLVGRPLDQEGAHCIYMNSKAIGICLVGNFDKAPVPRPQWTRAVTFVRSLMTQISIPVQNVVCHRDYAVKSCPGNHFDLNEFRQLLSWDR